MARGGHGISVWKEGQNEYKGGARGRVRERNKKKESSKKQFWLF